MDPTTQQPSNLPVEQGQNPTQYLISEPPRPYISQSAPGTPPPPAPPLALRPAPPTAASGNTPQSATDATALSDLDKEWVYRARAVIDHTKGDPFVQSRELAKVRAEYLRVRFDKHIKVAEEQSK